MEAQKDKKMGFCKEAEVHRVQKPDVWVAGSRGAASDDTQCVDGGLHCVATYNSEATQHLQWVETTRPSGQG